ncbi:putative Transmembrane and coiled-coil domain-containing protein, partial [Naja naja]
MPLVRRWSQGEEEEEESGKYS